MQYNKMTKQLISIIVILLSVLTKVNGQIISDSTLSVFCNKFVEWTLYKCNNDSAMLNDLTEENDKYGNVLIYTSFNNGKSLNKINRLNVKYFNDIDEILRIVKSSKRKNIKRLVLYVKHYNISGDTIEFAANARYNCVKKGLKIRRWHIWYKTISFMPWMGKKRVERNTYLLYYYTLGRFVYNYYNNSWEFNVWNEHDNLWEFNK